MDFVNLGGFRRFRGFRLLAGPDKTRHGKPQATRSQQCAKKEHISIAYAHDWTCFRNILLTQVWYFPLLTSC